MTETFKLRLATVGRGFALFLGGFTLFNILGDLLHSGFNMNHWWIDLFPLSNGVANVFLLLTSVFLLIYAIKPQINLKIRYTGMVLVGIVLLVAAINSVYFYILLMNGKISSLFPVPFTLLIFILLGVILFSIFHSISHEPMKRPLIYFGFVLVVCGVLFPLGQIYCFGKTDYRRKGDVAVIFGARVYADGRPSDALKDRVMTGVQLYREGRVKYLLMSGGPGDGKTHETGAMKLLAIKLGVPENAILIDTGGISTEKSVENTIEIFKKHKFRTVLVVSHFYHLPRIRMDYRRHGYFVYSVPAIESYNLTQMPYFVAREMAALLYYYFMPLKS